MTPAPEDAPRDDWSVYLVRCGDDSLYTGIARDVPRRLEEHRSAEGKGAKYLRGRGPLEVVLERRVGARGLALRVELRIKRMNRRQKERLLVDRGRLDGLVAELEAGPGGVGESSPRRGRAAMGGER